MLKKQVREKKDMFDSKPRKSLGAPKQSSVIKPASFRAGDLQKSQSRPATSMVKNMKQDHLSQINDPTHQNRKGSIQAKKYTNWARNEQEQHMYKSEDYSASSSDGNDLGQDIMPPRKASMFQYSQQAGTIKNTRNKNPIATAARQFNQTSFELEKRKSSRKRSSLNRYGDDFSEKTNSCKKGRKSTSRSRVHMKSVQTNKELHLSSTPKSMGPKKIVKTPLAKRLLKDINAKYSGVLRKSSSHSCYFTRAEKSKMTKDIINLTSALIKNEAKMISLQKRAKSS
jgi:hypothetical protein